MHHPIPIFAMGLRCPRSWLVNSPRFPFLQPQNVLIFPFFSGEETAVPREGVCPRAGLVHHELGEGVKPWLGQGGWVWSEDVQDVMRSWGIYGLRIPMGYVLGWERSVVWVGEGVVQVLGYDEDGG